MSYNKLSKSTLHIYMTHVLLLYHNIVVIIIPTNIILMILYLHSVCDFVSWIIICFINSFLGYLYIRVLHHTFTIIVNQKVLSREFEVIQKSVQNSDMLNTRSWELTIMNAVSHSRCRVPTIFRNLRKNNSSNYKQKR